MEHKNLVPVREDRVFIKAYKLKLKSLLTDLPFIIALLLICFFTFQVIYLAYNFFSWDFLNNSHEEYAIEIEDQDFSKLDSILTALSNIPEPKLEKKVVVKAANKKKTYIPIATTKLPKTSVTDSTLIDWAFYITAVEEGFRERYYFDIGSNGKKNPDIKTIGYGVVLNSKTVDLFKELTGKNPYKQAITKQDAETVTRVLLWELLSYIPTGISWREKLAIITKAYNRGFYGANSNPLGCCGNFQAGQCGSPNNNVRKAHGRRRKVENTFRNNAVPDKTVFEIINNYQNKYVAKFSGSN